MDRNEIMKLIPHRVDMLILDEVINLDDNSAVGKYKVTGKEFFFNGHYPNKPIVPGSILCEIMAQLIAVFASQRRQGLPLLAEINNAKFKKMAVPGNILLIRMDLIKDSIRIITANCSVSVDNSLIASAKLTVALL
ncbi:MAG: 3-hydroxyacyl-[acyl-carrier-protein] dehydratase FabZ [Eubacteriales bacterium SKADARSKE-1]|nr:3-hydroxyacyl-[acyl-carrier-protein] dehydratase FabZ [Eubacteriales bacterium SKADARSKE-1]